jgi:hypothetical protein
MNEQTGSTMIDSSGYGHHGVISNVAIGQPGVSGYSYRFNGSSSKVTVRHSAYLNPGSLNLRIDLAIKTPPTSGSTSQNVLQKGTSSTSGGHYKVEVLRGGAANGKPRCTFRGSSANVLVAGPRSIADNAWHSVSCIKTASSVSIVVDGVTTTKSGVAGSIANTAVLALGHKPTSRGSDFFDGYLDAVAISRG